MKKVEDICRAHPLYSMTDALIGALKRSGLLAILWLAAGATPVAQAAPVKIEVWHSLTGTHEAEFKKLVKRYNHEQTENEVALRGFASQKALQHAMVATTAARQPGTTPNLIQLKDNHSPEIVAERKAIKPLHTLLAQYPVKDLKWFLPVTTSFIRDDHGRVLAFPFMAEVPMMFYNKALYKKAGLPTNAPARTWAQLQDQLLALRDVAQVKCPYASGDQVAVHLENLAPINNQLYASNGNGMGLSRQPLPVALQFNSLYMRHVSLMATWKRALLLQQDSAEHKAKEMFASGQCGVLTARSGVLGQFRNAKSLSFGVAPLPYYTQATQQPGRPFVSGSALWALAGHPAAQEKATAAFLGWLAKPVIAAAWHQNTGYLPLTEAAFRASDVSFYKKIPGALEVVATMRQQPAANTRGFRMKNYPNIETVLHQGLSDAIDGKVPTMVALNKAASQALLLMAQKPPPRLVSRR